MAKKQAAAKAQVDTGILTAEQRAVVERYAAAKRAFNGARDQGAVEKHRQAEDKFTMLVTARAQEEATALAARVALPKDSPVQIELGRAQGEYAALFLPTPKDSELRAALMAYLTECMEAPVIIGAA